jgi:hypothetical protein
MKSAMQRESELVMHCSHSSSDWRFVLFCPFSLFFLSGCILEGVFLCAGGSLYLIYRTKSVVAAAGFLVGLGDSTNHWSDSLRKDEPLFLSSLMQSSRSR